MPDLQRVLHDRLRLLVEPAVERTREGRGGGDRQQQRGQRRDQAEKRHDARVQASARHLFLPGTPEPDHLDGDDDDHRDHEQRVDDQGREHDLVARHDRCQAGQDEVGREARNHRQADDDETDPEGPVAGARQRRAALEPGRPERMRLATRSCLKGGAHAGRRRRRGVRSMSPA